MKTQEQMFYESHRKVADANELAMEMFTDGSTSRQQLEKLIAKFPQRWIRFANWLDKLPNETGADK